ncbi:hypothetical protein DSCW_21530 [Desulfosarcina widdelii]|uniref:Integrase catalytic domain-containing protein n=1 Tax=Desulfosarcina widdelii TaxID=947919 RepID=A0A5K7YYI1_9BACT|nr:hypothetical protein [Desulfosarcina widdelii]BBO72983.1 hypothetical protein DSCW_04000 [Desulfosarcina widdelii]BBO74736.1 hypothetical protein DSCW_21530 [Desulfosarcina widdelii]
MIEDAKTKFSLSYACCAAQVGLRYRTLMRWKQRIASGHSALEKRGPKKVRPLNLAGLKQQIRDLDHGRKRSRGTGRLHDAHAESISRRELNELVREVRSATNAKPCQVVWLKPDLSWAMDGLEYRDCHVQNVQDLCSRYKFAPLTGSAEPCGEEIAGHLSRHFCRFGPPLFIKRDNAGNLNHVSVNALLEEHMVIPINSPFYTPSYNGAIEHSQGEVKTWLRKWKHAADTRKELALQVDNAAHAWNHLPRRSLSGKNACRAYFSSSRLRCTKRQRKEAYDWIFDLALDISQRAGKNEIDPTAWRVSARKWMERKRMIIIRKPEKVSPHLNRNLCHN